jgi:hypothetical protein
VLDEQEASTVKVIRGCPCFKVFGDEKLCVNNDRVLEIEALDLDPSMFSFHQDRESMMGEKASVGNLCYASIYINYPDNRVYCISQGWTLRIHGKDVPGEDLEGALQFLATKEATASAEICSECLYKFILTLGDTFSELVTLKEKTDEIKKYVNQFSLKIAVALSQNDNMLKPIGTEQDIEMGIDHFEFLREYLIQLLEQQHYFSNLSQKYNEENSEFWLEDLLRKRERLARMEFQFYSQALQLRDINDFSLMIKMLQFILMTSDKILELNDEIHSLIRSKKFNDALSKDDRLAILANYTEKSRKIEHNFGNILQILTKLR